MHPLYRIIISLVAVTCCAVSPFHGHVALGQGNSAIQLVSVSRPSDVPELFLVASSHCGRIHSWKKLNPSADRSFVICHGFGGTKPGDRFHELGHHLSRQFPESNVLLTEWNTAVGQSFLGIPKIWDAAARIDETGREMARLVRESDIDPSSLTRRV